MPIVNTPPTGSAATLFPLPNDSLAALLHELGDIPASRVRRFPYPGTATVADVERIQAHEGRQFELVDGVLVEKAMGFKESTLAGAFIEYLRVYSRSKKSGVIWSRCLIHI